MTALYASVTNTTGIHTVDVNESHQNATSIANISAEATTLAIGNSITVDIGYTTSHSSLFTGYVKTIEQTYPDGLYTITANDVMSRAQDFFIASDDPNAPIKKKNILAETLEQQIFALAGLSTFDGQSTSFTLGISNEFEINLVSVYDYCKMIADLLSYHIWATSDGTVHFRNRKPYTMVGSEPQPGWVNDTSSGTIDDPTSKVVLNANYSTNERGLRNKIVVYGAGNVHATASASSPYLPANFYKTTVVGGSQVLDTLENAQKTADYNLHLLNRLTYNADVSIIGDSSIRARNCYTLNIPRLGINSELWYAFSVSHSLSSAGYITNISFRK